MNKTVAELAAEQGLDEHTLVRVLQQTARRNLRPPTYNARKKRWNPPSPLLTTEQTARLFGVKQEEVEKVITPLQPWTEKLVIDALFAFYRQHQRWPQRKEWRSANKLPSLWTLTRLTNPSHFRWWRYRHHTAQTPIQRWRRPWDHYQRLIAKDRRCTARMAFQLRNVLARKEAIDRIGFNKLIKHAAVVDSHPEFGTLYSLPGETPTERMLLVKVVNSTPEPDGSFADYYLRVPPNMNSVQEAIAWTFALDANTEYQPLVET